MKTIIKLLLLGSFLLAQSTPGCSTSTIPINSLSTTEKAEPESADWKDQRLSQKVTYTVRNRKVSQILADLSTVTGVRLIAGFNELDWQVRDRRMVISVSDVPLGTLMDSISRVMKMKWVKSSQVEPPAYRLYMDRNILLEAIKQKQEQFLALKEKIGQLREQELARMFDLVDASPEQLEAVKWENPLLYEQVKSGAAGSLRSLFRVAPDLHSAFLAGSELDMPVSSLSPAAQDAVANMIEVFSQHKPRLYELVFPLPDNCAEHIAEMNLRINTGLSESLQTRSSDVLGHITLFVGPARRGVTLYNPENANIVRSKMYLMFHEEGVEWSEVCQKFQAEEKIAILNDIKNNPYGEPLIEHQDDPDLKKKITLKPVEKYLHEYQIAIAEESGFSVVSDYFGMREHYWAPPTQNVELRACLDRIQDEFHYNWYRRGSILEFQDRNWYEKRCAQLPDSWMEVWRNTLKQTGTMDLNHLTQIAQLTYDQFWHNFAEDELMGKGVWREIVAFSAPAKHGPLMRLYGSFSKNEQRALFTPGVGLRSGDFAPESARLLEAFLAHWEPISKRVLRSGTAQREFYIAATRTKVGKQYSYVFSFVREDDPDPVEITFLTPKYEPPAEKPSEAVK